MTQREAALAEKITPAMEQAALHEGLPPEVIRQGLARGTLVVPANREHRGLTPIAIGQGVKVKVNANIGTSPHDVCLEKEVAKLEAALEYGADAVMDLSTGGNLDEIRAALLAKCPVPFGTVPIYHVMTEAKSLDEVKGDWFLDMVQPSRPAGGGLCHGALRRHPSRHSPFEKPGHRGGLPGRLLSGGLDAPPRAGKPPLGAL